MRKFRGFLTSLKYPCRSLFSLIRLSEIDRSEGDINLSERRKEFQEKHLEDEEREILEEDSKYFLHQSLSTPCLNVIKSVEGIYLIDEQGRKIMDFHGNSVHQIGFSNEYVLDRVRELMDDHLTFCTRRYTNKISIEFAKKLVDISSDELTRVLFLPSGAGAVGLALKLARLVTGRHKTISMWDSFHGASLECISIGGETIFRESAGPLMTGCIQVPPPDEVHCIFGCNKNVTEDDQSNSHCCDLSCAEYVEYVLEREEISAVISEPIRWHPYIPRREYWQKIREACDRTGALLIFDEIPNSLGRTGEGMFTHEVFDVVPDILVLGKGLGGAMFPSAAVLAKEEYNEKCREVALGHYTHEKNPLLAAAGLATIEYIEDNCLVHRAKVLGRRVLEELTGWKSEYDGVIGGVRGIGLLIGIELVEGRNYELAETIMYDALSKGLSFKLTMGNIITLCPPLIITDEEMDEALGILKSCFDDCCCGKY